MNRPIHWLGPGHHDVNYWIGVGKHSVQAGLNHMALIFGTADKPQVTVYNSCRPNCYLFPPLKPGMSLPHSFEYFDFGFHFQMDPSSLPVPFMSSSDLVNWWKMWLKPDDFSDEDFADLLAKPESLVRFGFCKMFMDIYWESEETSELAACLSMIGVGAIEILLAGTCNLCRLRRTGSASKRCEQCSRSKQFIEGEGHRKQSARSMRNKRIQMLSKMPISSRSYELHISYSRSIVSILFKIGKKEELHQHWLEAIESSLKVAPLVRQKLPSDFLEISLEDQLVTLRDIIDPHEWDYAVWPAKILGAEKLEEASEALTARRRFDGPLPKTIDLANKARDLISQGLTKSEVALRLSISKSHLSHTLARTSIPPKQ